MRHVLYATPVAARQVVTKCRLNRPRGGVRAACADRVWCEEGAAWWSPGLPDLALKGQFGLFRGTLAFENLGLEATHISAFSTVQHSHNMLIIVAKIKDIIS